MRIREKNLPLRRWIIAITTAMLLAVICVALGLVFFSRMTSSLKPGSQSVAEEKPTLPDKSKPPEHTPKSSRLEEKQKPEDTLPYPVPPPPELLK